MKIIIHLHSTAKYNILKKQTKKDCPLGQSFFYFNVTPRNS